MIHGTKMLLVPQESAEILPSEVPAGPAPVGSFSKMDQEMSNILKNSKLNDRDKLTLYEQVLQRYMNRLNKIKTSDKIIRRESAEEDIEEISDEDTDNPSSEGLLSKLAKSLKSNAQRAKAQVLFSLLKRSEEISWNESGELTINNVKKGNVEEILNYCMRQTPKGKSPDGYAEFKVLLKKLKVPSIYVNNFSLKNYLKKQKTSPKPRIKTPKLLKRTPTPPKPNTRLAVANAAAKGNNVSWDIMFK